MSNYDAEQIKPLRKDVLLKHLPKRERNNSTIYIKDTADDKLQSFVVLKVGSEVENVKPGDVVLVPWVKVTPPFDVAVSGTITKVGITSEREIYAILEE